ncbi:MAG: sugar ABC transporter substrate-binding protein [Pseudobutyrivibrio sp.]|nr:sugar ABC transporter substrate-binding protein [Pseudobutyrivibrio sp.]
MKKYKWRIIAGAVIVIALITVAIFYNHKQRNTLEVAIFAGSYWDVANANSYVIIDEAISRFEEAHPGVTVHYYSGIRKEDYSEWFSRKVLTGDEADVFLILGEDFNEFAELGVMKNLDSFIKNDSSFDESRYYETSLKSGQYQGNQYGLPYETVPTLMFVNKSLLNREGLDVPENNWTWDDMYNICEKVTRDFDGDGILDQFGTYNYGWTEAVYSNGANLFNENGTKSYFNDEKVVEAVKFTKKIADLNNGTRVTKDDFDAGNVAFMPLPFTEYRTYKTYPYRIKKYRKFQWDCITLPAGPNGGNVSAVNSLLMGISNRTNNEKLAWEFLKLMTYDSQTQSEIFEYSQAASAIKSVTESQKTADILAEDMEKNEKVIDNKVLSKMIEYGAVTPKFSKYNDALALADNEINDLISNGDNVENSLRILQRQITAFLKR